MSMNIAITGATSGIGKQLALDYLRAGHSVWGIGRNQRALEALADQGITPIQLDLLDRCKTLEKLQSLPTIDLAILCAGTCEYIDMPHFDSELFARIMRINTETLANSIEALLPALLRSQTPHLVGIGSASAILPLPRAEAYGASKAAIHYLLKTLRISLRQQGVTVSLVCPGFVDTPLTAKNDFPMPFQLTTTEASAQIRRGIARKKAFIHFPKRLTLLMRAASWLPSKAWEKLAKGMVRNGGIQRKDELV